MMRKMEQDVGLGELSNAELDVLLAAHAVTKGLGEAITSEQIRRHDLASDIAPATYHRALRSLLARGLIDKANGYKTSRYVVPGDLPTT
ncbi:hypothetical protein GV827_22015 [Sulfitobacter sp. JBTF-M27]|uniref:MarR family transcriptional regulator n=2 Tax=Sulfitobacter sediminilitoris TaxID=2698830 RepID=A0A6P0CJ25_9RHOB|nr:hypothetical protein [Sulfitobacter sediminilitoris]